jgi:ABC-type lipoprotein release transport system permease subunit
MGKENLENLSKEELLKKEKDTKTFMGLFVGLIIGLLFFNIRDYLGGKEVDGPISIITLCTMGGLASLYPGLKSIQSEIKRRS